MNRIVCHVPGCGRVKLRIKDGRLIDGRGNVWDPEDDWVQWATCRNGHEGYNPQQLSAIRETARRLS